MVINYYTRLLFAAATLLTSLYPGARVTSIFSLTFGTEATLLSKRTIVVAEERGIQVGGRLLYFNKRATRWLGVWLDSHLALREHHNVRMKKARVAQTRL